MNAPAAVLTERRGTALWLTINRPDRRNAINGDVIAGIAAGIERALGDDTIRAIVLTGTGEKAFCAGGDLQQGTSVFGDQIQEPTTDFGRLARLARTLGIPLVARINGACVAGGMGLMALCDLVVAADHARFGLPEAKVGVFPMQVQVYFRNMILPRHVAELCFTGELIDCPRAREIGLINYAVPAEELDAKVDWLLGKLRASSPLATKRGKYVMAAMESMGFHEAIAFAEGQIMLTAMTGDAREGLAAFNEKRAAHWVEQEDD
jgi:enoyl-CoA hydratase/carnithine racemase